MHSTVGQIVAEAAARFGDRTAVVAVDRTLTFSELHRLSGDFARALAARGIAPGDRVTLWIENGWRWMVAYYGVLKLGAIVNPCNILLTADEVAYIADDCGAKAIIAACDKVSSIEQTTRAQLLIDRDLPGADYESMDRLLAVASSASGDEPSWSDANSASTIGYTSGTTGRPKGAVLRHSTIVMNTAMTSLMHGRTAQDCVVSALPCTHVYGNIVMNSAVLCGMKLVLLPRFDETEVLTAIQTHRATLFEGVPTMFMRLLNCRDIDRFDLSSLRICTVGGQTMPVATMEDVQRRFGCPLIELWGMTELGGLGTTHPHNGPRRLGSIGIALPFTQVKVVDPADVTREQPVDVVGELMIRGPLVMQGYYNNEAATRETIEADGWLHTGDLVRRDADGFLYVVDRAKEVILSGGYNVYPAEVERVIAQHPAVAMVAVAPMHDDLRGQVPKAFIVPKRGMRCTTEEIIEHCRPHLAKYKLPREIALLDDLPKTSTGKILRRMLANVQS